MFDVLQNFKNFLIEITFKKFRKNMLNTTCFIKIESSDQICIYLIKNYSLLFEIFYKVSHKKFQCNILYYLHI